MPPCGSNQRAFPSCPPQRCFALGLDPRSRRRCRSPGLGMLRGWAERSSWGLGSFPSPIAFPHCRSQGCSQALTVQGISLPSPTHGSCRRLGWTNSHAQEHFPLHLHLPPAKSRASPQKCSLGSLSEPVLPSEYCVPVFAPPQQLGQALEPIR